jgi:hypothetical protein
LSVNCIKVVVVGISDLDNTATNVHGV